MTGLGKQASELSIVLDGAERIMQMHVAVALGKRGSYLRRDNVVSVLYSEGLNSTKSSVFLQRTDRHGIVGQKSPPFQVSL